MKYPSHIIDEVLSRADIVNIISGYIELRRSGANYKGICPFHNDNDPSMVVSPTKQIFKCFVCQEGGNAISFVQKYTGISFIEALQTVAKSIGYELPKQEQTQYEKSKNDIRDQVKDALTYTANFYHQKLFSPEGKHALDYLLKRGLTEDIIKKFNLGYAPDSWDATKNELMRLNFTEETLLEARVLSRSSKGTVFDVFRNRLMFPIRDYMGHTIAFGGRKLDEDPQSPKYINSPDSIVYNKSHVLFGLYDAKREIKENVILVEGYMDLIALHQFGINNIVAPCGTALTTEQANIVKRYTKNMILMYDGDNAGLKAAERNLEIAIKAGLTTKTVILPDGEDPDDILRNRGVKAMQKFINEANNFIDFYLLRNRDIINSPEGKAEITRKLVGIITSIPDSFVHDDYIQELRSKLLLSDAQIQKVYEEKSYSAKPNVQSNNQRSSERVQNNNIDNTPSIKVIIGDTGHLLPKDATNDLSLAELQLIKILVNSESTIDIIEEFDINYQYFHSNLGENLFSIIYEISHDYNPITKAPNFINKPDYHHNLLLAISIPMEDLNANWTINRNRNRTTKELLNTVIAEIIRNKLKNQKQQLEMGLHNTSNPENRHDILVNINKMNINLMEKDMLQFKDELLSNDEDVSDI